YIRDLIRREQERSAETESVRAALLEGENSGEPKAFDAVAFKQRMLATHG
ncbi:MAG: ribbon-helix-helix domain-containing protein, partial [Candidatus Angelobacter sp.]